MDEKFSSSSNNPFSEDELLPVSALEHLLYCRRRAALVHMEGIWADNIFTSTGKIMQTRIDDSRRLETRGDIRSVRGLLVCSYTLGLTGKCDIVEFHKPPPAQSEKEIPFPIEHKRGRLRSEEGYMIQLCAQAICLEEMLSTHIPQGAIYFGKTGRRLEVQFDPELRGKTVTAAAELHNLIRSAKTPPAENGPKCEKCSLNKLCLPKINSASSSAISYINKLIAQEDDP